MKPGDRITRLNATPVWTFADLQYHYDKVHRKADRIQITVERNGVPVELPIALPERWWWTDLTFRQSSVEPRVYFDSHPLAESEKHKYGLARDGFASEVKRVDMLAEMMKSHELRTGDIVFGVDGVERDEIADTVDLYIKLRKAAGDTVTLDVIRGGKRMKMKLKTYRMSFRK